MLHDLVITKNNKLEFGHILQKKSYVIEKIITFVYDIGSKSFFNIKSFYKKSYINFNGL
jgi:hypothetical protein